MGVLQAHPGRLLWRCRRGMKELDVMLERFARGALVQAPAQERALFEELLALPDPLLASYLLDGEVPPEARSGGARGAHPGLMSLGGCAGGILTVEGMLTLLNFPLRSQSIRARGRAWAPT